MWILLLIFILVLVVFILVSTKPTRLTPHGAHVMVTGGSSGIGLAVAKVKEIGFSRSLSKRGWAIWPKILMSVATG